ncbi:hypothetical protein [Tsuneonella sp. HG222]
MGPVEAESDDEEDVRIRSRRRRLERDTKLRQERRRTTILHNLRWIGTALVVGLPVMIGLLYLLYTL